MAGKRKKPRGKLTLVSCSKAGASRRSAFVFLKPSGGKVRANVPKILGLSRDNYYGS